MNGKLMCWLLGYGKEKPEEMLGEQEQAKQEWLEMKAEESRLEDMPYEPRDREQFIDKNEQ